MKRFIAVFALLLCAVVASAGEAKKDWAESAEAYFMTAAEREQWKSVATDEAAQTFVNDFRARRGGELFTKEVTKRVEMADKYLTIGKTKGSTTLRGKLVVLFGAPANISVSDRQGKGGYIPPASSAAVTNLGTGASTQAGDDSGDSQQLGQGVAGRAFRDFTFTFSAKSVPALNGKDLTLTVEADAATGKDRFPKSMKEKDVEALFEAAAQGSIKQ
jgi:GWxTD domain-containing protein